MSVGPHAYAYYNRLSGLAASAFTWGTAATTNRTYLNDGRMDRQFNVGAANGGVYLYVDMGTAYQLAGWAVLNSNIASAGDGALRIRAADDAGITTNVVTPKATTTLNATAPYQKDHVLQLGGSSSKRYWELLWTWTGTFTLKIGELFAYTAPTQLSRRSIYGSGETREAIVAQSQMQYGETRGLFLAGPIRQLDLQWDDLTASQRNELYQMHVDSSFGASPLLWIPSYESSTSAAATTEQEVIFGRLTRPAFTFSEKDFSLYQPGGFSIRSLGREAGS